MARYVDGKCYHTHDDECFYDSGPCQDSYMIVRSKNDPEGEIGECQLWFCKSNYSTMDECQVCNRSTNFTVSRDISLQRLCPERNPNNIIVCYTFPYVIRSGISGRQSMPHLRPCQRGLVMTSNGLCYKEDSPNARLFETSNALKREYAAFIRASSIGEADNSYYDDYYNYDYLITLLW